MVQVPWSGSDSASWEEYPCPLSSVASGRLYSREVSSCSSIFEELLEMLWGCTAFRVPFLFEQTWVPRGAITVQVGKSFSAQVYGFLDNSIKIVVNSIYNNDNIRV